MLDLERLRSPAAFTKSQSDYNGANTDGTISTVVFIAGGAALVAGGILSSRHQKAGIFLGSAGLCGSSRLRRLVPTGVESPTVKGSL